MLYSNKHVNVTIFSITDMYRIHMALLILSINKTIIFNNVKLSVTNNYNSYYTIKPYLYNISK